MTMTMVPWEYDSEIKRHSQRGKEKSQIPSKTRMSSFANHTSHSRNRTSFAKAYIAHEGGGFVNGAIRVFAAIPAQ